MSYEVTFKTKEPTKVYGMRWQGSDVSEIKDLWDRYIKADIAACGDVPHGECYGVCRMTPGLPKGEFEYLAGRPWKEGTKVPDGMEVWDVPGGEFAVCTVPNLGVIHEAFQWFFGDWLKESGKVHDERPSDAPVDFELYPPEYTDGAPFYIYMPIKTP